MGGGGGSQAKFTPLLREGQKGFTLDLGKREGGNKKVCRLISLVLGFSKFFKKRMTFNVLVPQ